MNNSKLAHVLYFTMLVDIVMSVDAVSNGLAVEGNPLGINVFTLAFKFSVMVSCLFLGGFMPRDIYVRRGFLLLQGYYSVLLLNNLSFVVGV